MPRGFALTVVNWTCVTMSWTLSMNGTTATVERRTRGVNRKLKQSHFLFSSWFFYHFYYLLFEVIHQQAEAQLFNEVIIHTYTQKLPPHIQPFHISQQLSQISISHKLKTRLIFKQYGLVFWISVPLNHNKPGLYFYLRLCII